MIIYHGHKILSCQWYRY